MPTIKYYRRILGWSQYDLARLARLNPNTVRKAENGKPISGQTAIAIVDAFNEALGEHMLVRDIEGLNVTV
ncbi:helix-turn-helix domain-containing protein [Ktedonosporobacter rubrisoli]|nr:helix-turn-helix transcriptional regulator [Ktedonosporobacter rubrisoli]